MLSFCQAAAFLDFRQEWRQPEKQNRLNRCGQSFKNKIVKQSVPIRLAEQLHSVCRVLGKVNKSVSDVKLVEIEEKGGVLMGGQSI